MNGCCGNFQPSTRPHCAPSRNRSTPGTGRSPETTAMPSKAFSIPCCTSWSGSNGSCWPPLVAGDHPGGRCLLRGRPQPAALHRGGRGALFHRLPRHVEDTMRTLAIIFVSTLIAIAIGIPVGIWMSRSNRVQTVTTPVLDVMQTMPIFVYLIPVVMLFGLGKIPGLIAVVIYAVPPVIRSPTWGSGWWTRRCWRPRTPSARTPGGGCSTSRCRWRSPTSWRASTRPS